MIVSTEKAGVPRQMGKLDYSTALTITRKIKEPARQIEVAREIAVTPVHGRKLRDAIEKAATEPSRPLQDIVKEVTEEPCELPFNSSEKALILAGAKTQVTSAARPDARIRAGEMVYASVLEPHFARLRVVSVERRKLKYFGKEDASAEGNQSLEEFQRAWKRKHGQWDDNQLVYVVRFEKT
jgi:hypothetical protein